MIDHERFRLLAAKRVGGRLDPDEATELDTHLASCRPCRIEADQLERDHRLLSAALSDAPVAPQVRSAVVAAARGGRRSSPWLLLAAAALLLLALSAAVVFVGTSQPSPAIDSSRPPELSPTAPLLPTPSPQPSPSPSPAPSPSPSPSPDRPSPGPEVSITGEYRYVVVKGRPGRSVTLDVHGTDPVLGSWSLRAAPDGPLQGGPVTCLVVKGRDAFMFGPATTGERAAFLWVRDGKTPGGADDMAVTWMQDLPGDPLPSGLKPQTLEEMEGWCRNAGQGRPDGLKLIPLASGNLTIRNGS